MSETHDESEVYPKFRKTCTLYPFVYVYRIYLYIVSMGLFQINGAPPPKMVRRRHREGTKTDVFEK